MALPIIFALALVVLLLFVLWYSINLILQGLAPLIILGIVGFIMFLIFTKTKFGGKLLKNIIK